MYTRGRGGGLCSRKCPKRKDLLPGLGRWLIRIAECQAFTQNIRNVYGVGVTGLAARLRQVGRSPHRGRGLPPGIGVLLDLQSQRGPFIGKVTRARGGIRISGFFGGTQPLSSLSAAILYGQH